MICDLSHYGCIKISGPDAQTFLQGQLTCDMRQITAEKASYAAYCNNKGKTIALLRVIKIDDDYFLFSTGPYIELCFKNLKKFGQFSKVDITLESRNLKHYGISGNDKLDIEFPTEINQVIKKDDYVIVKNAGENNFELFSWTLAYASVKTEKTDEPWQLILIDTIVPAITEETCEKYTPHMLGLKNLEAISFKKGCYIGQEIIARTEHLGKVKRTLQKAKSTDNIGTIINRCQDVALHISDIM